MLLAASTVTYWYVHNYYMRTCMPSISPTYVETIAKKHAAQTLYLRNKKQKEAELQKNSAIIANYARIIELHTEPTHNAQLTELKLFPQDITAHYSVTNHNSIQNCVDTLSEIAAIEEVSLESVEQRNSTSTCTLHAPWKK